AQNETLASREELSITLMSIGDGVIATDTSGNITRMNPVAELLTGFTVEEAKGKHLEKVFHIINSETGEPVDCPFKKVIQTGETVDLSNHTLLISRNGKQYHIADSAAPIINKEGQIIGVILVFSDVSTRYKIQNELNKERNLLRKVIDALPFSLYIKDKNGKKILVNQTEIKYIGKPIEAIIDKTDFEVYEKEYAEKYWADDSEVINNQTIITDRQEPVPDSTGNIRWVSTNKIPWLDENGNVLGLIGFGIDITDRIEDQMKIKRLSEGIEQSPNAVIITNHDGKIEYVNPRFEEMTGYKLEQVRNKFPRVMKPHKNEPNLHIEIWEALKNQQKWKGEYLSKKASGEEYWEQITASPIFDNHNNVSNILLIIEDISDRKKMIEDLKIARDRAEESDKLKSAFLANMSHEIRTPMNGILGFAELLRESHLKKDTKEKYLELIEQSGYRMLNIINDIIDISKIEAGQISLYIKPTAINKILQHQFDFFKTEIERKGLNFKLNKGLPDGDDILNTDAQRLEQVITNLLKNAIKFTNIGEIELGYYQHQNTFRFYVRDTGIGIDENLKEQVFERFRQGELLLTKQYEG
ncbi:MAG: PAS domain-containing protein, partial [Prolixibacteraceae bacterium]|nr:PAS domain-containing protein [Prolixibacteraceae bacterium]